MPTPDQFAKYFHDRADLAESLHRNGWRNEGQLVAAVALDSLASIWEHSRERKKTSRASLRLHEFVRTFTQDPKADKIAVVFMAEDMLAHGPQRLHAVANRLLDARVPSRSEKAGPMEFRQSPATYLDKPWDVLVAEEPSLASETRLQELSSDYTYPATLYRLYRCGLAHSFAKGDRTSGFSGNEPDDDISYFPEWTDGARRRPIGLKFGLKVVTTWVREAATRYAAACSSSDVDPVAGFDPSSQSLGLLQEYWKHVVPTSDPPIEGLIQTLRRYGQTPSLHLEPDGSDPEENFRRLATQAPAELNLRSIGNWEHLTFAYLNAFLASQFTRKLALRIDELGAVPSARAEAAGMNVLVASQMLQSAIILHLRTETWHDRSAMALARTALEAAGRAALITSGAGDEASRWSRRENFTARRCLAALNAAVSLRRRDVLPSRVYEWLCNFAHMNAAGVAHFFDGPETKHEDAYAAIAFVSWAIAVAGEDVIGEPIAQWPILPPYPWGS
jgi:hypothetical protein